MCCFSGGFVCLSAVCRWIFCVFVIGFVGLFVWCVCVCVCVCSPFLRILLSCLHFNLVFMYNQFINWEQIRKRVEENILVLSLEF